MKAKQQEKAIEERFRKLEQQNADFVSVSQDAVSLDNIEVSEKDNDLIIETVKDAAIAFFKSKISL